jgi:sugar phosphate isomerase/epimerase
LGGMPVSLHSAIVHSLAEHQAQVDAAHDLGASVLVVHSDEFFVQGQRDLDVALCREVVAYAADQKVQVALENGQLPFLERAIDMVDGLKICLDIGHVYLTDAPLRDFLTVLKPYLIHLHLQDILSPAESGTPHAGADHYTLGTGGIPAKDWELLIATLQEINFEGMAVLEIQPRNPYQTARLSTRFFDSLLTRKRTLLATQVRWMRQDRRQDRLQVVHDAQDDMHRGRRRLPILPDLEPGRVAVQG